MRHPGLKKAVEDHLGCNGEKEIAHYIATLASIYQDRIEWVQDRNNALREITDAFGVHQGFLCVRLRGGSDYATEKNFDLMVDYATRHYPQFIGQSQSGESECGSAEERFSQWAAEGLLQPPSPLDPDLFSEADQAVGEAFWTHIDERESLDAQTEKKLSKLEKAYDRVVDSIATGADRWAKYWATRLRNEISRLPAKYRSIAIDRTRLYEIEQLIQNEVVPF